MYKRTKYAPKKKYQRKYKLGQTVKRVMISLEEKKHCENAVLNAGSASTWYIANILCNSTATATDQVGSGIVQGAGYNQRIGEKIRLQRIECAIAVIPSVANMPTNGSTCRILIVRDKEPHFSYPTTASILTPDNNILGLQNLTFKNRFTIIKDFIHEMVPISTDTGAGAVVRSVGPKLIAKFNIYCKNELVSYSGTVGTNIAYNKVAYYVLFAHDTGASACCNVSMNTTVVFTDA